MAVSTATQADYAWHLAALRPAGPAWAPDDPHIEAAAEEFARIHNRSIVLIDEADPRSTSELLIDWERIAGLPDSCVPAGQTLQERRDALVARLTSTGGQSRQYFIALASALGYSVTITEFRPFVAGSTAGAPLTNGEWVFTWRVNAPQTTYRAFLAGSGVAGEPLRSWGNELLECVIRARKPAHTHLLFGYGG